MERRTGRDFGLSLRLGIALLGLGVLYLPLPIAFVMFVLGFTASWLLAIAALAIVVVLLCFLPGVSARIALFSARASEVTASDEPELHALLERLAAMADLPAPKLAIAPTEVPNAFAVSRSTGDAVVVVTRGLLNRLTLGELEAVLAHELTHVASRDAFVMTLVSAPAILGRRAFGAIAGAVERASGPGKALAAFAFFYLLFPLFFGWVLYAVATGLVRTVSRYREFVADRGSVLLTGAPEQLMSALQRLAAELPQIPREDLRAVSGASALFILPAEPAGFGSGFDPARLFASHPSLEQRLDRLSGLARAVRRPARAEELPPPKGERPPLSANPRALLAFFFAAVYWCFIASYWLGGDPFETVLPVAAAWIAGVVLGVQGAGRPSAGASGMGFAVGALALLVGPWVFAIVGFLVVFLLGSAGVGPF
jgi:heat shock protein HtpX